MSKYFKYPTLQALREDIQARGLGIYLEEKIDKILQPVKIKGRHAGNALGIQPMEGCDGDLEGTPGPLTFRRWERFGHGGAKLIWGEATAISRESRANPRQLLINEKNLPHFANLLIRTRKAHKEIYGTTDDLIIGLQVTHSGRYSYQRPIIAYHHPQVDSLTYVHKQTKSILPKDYPLVSDDYLERLEDEFVATALLIEKVGFDFVDIKQCHTYLLSELLGARTRPGKYGGSFENRTRLIRNILGKVRQVVGSDFIIASRINAYDGIPYRQNESTGIGEPMKYEIPYRYSFGVDPTNPLRENLTEVKEFIRLMVTGGISLLNISMGSPYYSMHIGRPYEKAPLDGYESPEHPLEGVERHFRITGELQKSFPDVPMIGTGYSWLQRYLINAAEANVRKGLVSIASVGRGAIAYPDFVKDLIEHGEMKRAKVCLAVSYCTNLMRSKHNEFGQFETGCVPRDPIYAEIYKETLKEKEKTV